MWCPHEKVAKHIRNSEMEIHFHFTGYQAGRRHRQYPTGERHWHLECTVAGQILGFPGFKTRLFNVFIKLYVMFQRSHNQVLVSKNWFHVFFHQKKTNISVPNARRPLLLRPSEATKVNYFNYNYPFSSKRFSPNDYQLIQKKNKFQRRASLPRAYR